MPSLTPEQQRQKQLLQKQNEFTRIFDRFKSKIDDIASIFIDPLTELKLCTSPNGLSERRLLPPYSGLPLSHVLSLRLLEKRGERRILLKQLSDDLIKIREILPFLSENERRLKQDELDQLLLTQFEYVYYRGYSVDPHAYHYRPLRDGTIGIDGIDRPPYG